MIRLTPKESRYFFFIPGDEKKFSLNFQPGSSCLVGPKKWCFDPWDVKSIVLRLCGFFVWFFLGRHIDMSYYYSSVFLFLKNFLVFFFLFFCFIIFWTGLIWTGRRLIPDLLGFFCQKFWLFFSGRIHSGNPSPGNECKNGRQIFGKVGLLNTTVWTWNDLWIIREKTESLVGMNYQLLAIVTLKRKREKPLIIEYFSKHISWKFFGALANQNE